MGRSQRISSEDVRAMLRIVAELHELPADVETLGKHLMTRICELVGGRMALVGVLRITDGATCPQLIRSVAGGCVDSQLRSAYERYIDGVYATDPTLAALRELAGQTVVCAREELIRDRDWYRNPHVAEVRREADIDGDLAGVHPLREPGLFASFAVSRAWGDKHFGMRERTLLNLLNSELGSFYRRLSHSSNGSPLSTLAPQVRRTLEVLLRGLSEKHAARQLGLSRHTVHDYVKTLYRRFDVNSRPELMAKCLPLLRSAQPTRNGDTDGRANNPQVTQPSPACSNGT